MIRVFWPTQSIIIDVVRIRGLDRRKGPGGSGVLEISEVVNTM